MKKLIGAGLASLLAFSLLGSPATAKAPKQVVEGNIVLPAPFTDDSGCFAGLHRRGAIMTMENNNGAVGWHFDVDPKTVGKKFTLEVSDGAGMDIVFYSELGDATDPTVAPANTGYETPGPGGEKGTVPPGYPIAFVCMTEGADASFTYTAGL